MAKGLDFQEQELVRQALDQWLAQDQESQPDQVQAQVLALPEQVQAQPVEQVQVRAQGLPELVEQVLVQLAQVEQVQVQVVQLVQARVEKSQGKALAQAALELAQEQRRLVRLQLAQV